MAEVILKQCPFCGGTAKLMRGDILDMTVEFTVRYVGCGSCLVQGPISKTDDEATQRWNTRVHNGARSE